tara:strand:+ start:4731 stop:8285 length:3555 start_codon:yes stop_codon:yes gene_type:complete
MPLSREERKLLHQKSKQPTFGHGKPEDSDGKDGDISFRQIEGSGTVEYVKSNNQWIAVASSGEMPAVRVVGSGGGGSSSSSTTITDHGSLSGLSDDDHTQYLKIDGSRAMTGDLTLIGGDGALNFTAVGENSIKIVDNTANALIIEEADNAYLTFVTTNSGEKITLGKKLEAGSVEIEGSAFDIDGGDISAATISGGLTWSSAQDLNSQALTNANIDSGAIDGTPIGANSANTGAFTTITASTSIDITGATGLILSNDETITNATNGQVDINGNLQIGSGSGDATLKSSGNHNLTLQTGNSTTGSITITDGANGNIAITPNGTGYVPIGSSTVAGSMADLLSSDQKTALADALDGTNSKFDFATGSTDLAVSNGFTASNATFVNNSGRGKLTNSTSAAGSVYIQLSDDSSGFSYEVVFDVISGGNTDVEVCLSSTTSWNPSAESGARGVGTGHSLIKNYNSEDDNLYLIIRNISSTSGHYSLIDNMYARKAVSFTGGEIGSSSFVSGFAGSGWKVDKGATALNEYDLTVDNMFVRGRLSVYELLIQQIRATNGAVFVTSAAKVASTNSLSASDQQGDITFEDPSGHGVCPFAANDIIMMQRVVPGSLVAGNAQAPVGDVIKKLVYKVISVSNEVANVDGRYATTGYTNTDFPVEGDDFVRIGNTNVADRQGSIYLTSDDSNAPFMDIKDGINSYSAWNTATNTKVRLGKLDGITDASAGLDGTQSDLYGLYSGDVYLKGSINAKTGYIGANASGANGWVIAESKISSSDSTDIIGLVQSNAAHSDVGSKSAFYAGASATTGQNAKISFASDGKIRGNGIYRKNNIDYLITASRLFGNGKDGELRITSSSLTSDQNAEEDDLGDNWIASGVLQRDIYATDLLISSGVTCNTNGYRIFVRDTLTIGGSGAKFFNNGSDGDNGNNAGPSISAPGAGGSGSGAGGAEGSLRGGQAGGNGGAGGNGTDGSSPVGPGITGSVSTVTSNIVSSYTNGAGGRGGDGESGGSGAGSAAAASATSGSEGKISITNADLTYIVAMRDMFAVGNNAPSLYPALGAAGGGGGGGGAWDTTNSSGAGGGGGQGGGSGGHVMVVARIISGTQSNLELEAKGGSGGDGGNGHSPTGYNGGRGAGGNGGDGGCVTVISGTDPDGITIDVNGGTAGSNGSGNATNAVNPSNGQTGTSIVIHC